MELTSMLEIANGRMDHIVQELGGVGVLHIIMRKFSDNCLIKMSQEAKYCFSIFVVILGKLNLNILAKHARDI